MSSKRTIEERMTDKEKQLNEMLEKARAYSEQLKVLRAKKKDQERRERNHRLIEIGAACESVLGCPIEKEDLPNLLAWLHSQEEKGHYFSRALGKNKPDTAQGIETLPEPETYGLE